MPLAARRSPDLFSPQERAGLAPDWTIWRRNRLEPGGFYTSASDIWLVRSLRQLNPLNLCALALDPTFGVKRRHKMIKSKLGPQGRSNAQA